MKVALSVINYFQTRGHSRNDYSGTGRSGSWTERSIDRATGEYVYTRTLFLKAPIYVHFRSVHLHRACTCVCVCVCVFARWQHVENVHPAFTFR